MDEREGWRSNDGPRLKTLCVAAWEEFRFTLTTVGYEAGKRCYLICIPKDWPQAGRNVGGKENCYPVVEQWGGDEQVKTVMGGNAGSFLWREYWRLEVDWSIIERVREGFCFLLKAALVIIFIGWIEPLESDHEVKERNNWTESAWVGERNVQMRLGEVGAPSPDTVEEEGGTMGDRVRLQAGQEQGWCVIRAACTVGWGLAEAREGRVSGRGCAGGGPGHPALTLKGPVLLSS